MMSQDANALILDECSMIDLNLFATLIRAVNWNSVQRLILVGDPNQLPSIGREKVFGRSDVIDVLGITERPASTLLGKMYSLDLTEKITGAGKGKYRFIV